MYYEYMYIDTYEYMYIDTNLDRGLSTIFHKEDVNVDERSRSDPSAVKPRGRDQVPVRRRVGESGSLRA